MFLRKIFKLPIIQLILPSMIYLFGVFYFFDMNFDKLKRLNLSELGSFLSGVFSPLAFLGLIFGYMQQGKAIKENSSAINEQLEESRLSRKIMIESYQPKLSFKYISKSHIIENMNLFTFQITNTGESCSINSIVYPKELKRNIKINFLSKNNYISRDKSISFSIQVTIVDHQQPIFSALSLEMFYTDIFDYKYRQELNFTFDTISAAIQINSQKYQVPPDK